MYRTCSVAENKITKLNPLFLLLTFFCFPPIWLIAEPFFLIFTLKIAKRHRAVKNLSNFNISAEKKNDNKKILERKKNNDGWICSFVSPTAIIFFPFTFSILDL